MTTEARTKERQGEKETRPDFWTVKNVLLFISSGRMKIARAGRWRRLQLCHAPGVL